MRILEFLALYAICFGCHISELTDKTAKVGLQKEIVNLSYFPISLYSFIVIEM